MKEEMPLIVGSKTLLPISFVIAIMGGVVYLASLSFKVEAQGHMLDQQDARITKQMKYLMDINERTIRIEEHLKK